MIMRDQLSKPSHTVGSPTVGQLLHMGGGTFLVTALLLNKVTKLDKAWYTSKHKN